MGGENFLATFLSVEGGIRLHFSVWKGESFCYISQYGRGNLFVTFLSGEGGFFSLHFSGEEGNYISRGRRGTSTLYISQWGESSCYISQGGGGVLHHPLYLLGRCTVETVRKLKAANATSLMGHFKVPSMEINLPLSSVLLSRQLPQKFPWKLVTLFACTSYGV